MTVAGRPLCSLADGYTQADVARLTGMPESTLNRLWDDEQWFDKIRGDSLQLLISALHEVETYVSWFPVASRRDPVVERLAAHGAALDRVAYDHLLHTRAVPEQHLVSALRATAAILDGHTTEATELLSTFWLLTRDHALSCVFAPPDRDGYLPEGHGLLIDPVPVVDASIRLMHQLRQQPNAFLSVLAFACLAHHVPRITGDRLVERSVETRAADRQTSLAYRSMTMGLIVETNDHDLVARYRHELDDNRVLSKIEDWALPGQTSDIAITPNLYLPRRVALERTAARIVVQIENYNDAYLEYLVSTTIPRALRRDPTFGFMRDRLEEVLRARLDTLTDSRTRKHTTDLLKTLKEGHDR